MISKLSKHVISLDKLKLYSASNDLHLYLTICDEKMSLGLFKNDDSFDQNRILISQDSKSYQWADELFNHMKHRVIK